MHFGKVFLRSLRYGGGFLLLLALTFGGYVAWVQYHGNFDTVVEGQVYRSAQPTAIDIKRYAANYGIRSIINLRGPSSGKAWYDDEVSMSKELGIQHYDYGMSARAILSQERAKQLIDLIDRAEKPVLIHCQWGADRSGLAAALYLAAIVKHGEQAAESQISIRYGHVSLPWLKPYAMDRTFEELEPWLGFPDS